MTAEKKAAGNRFRAWWKREQAPLSAALRDTALAEAPLRAELFSADQMERHGAVLAQGHTLSSKPVANPLLSRLADNERVLIESCHVLSNTVSKSYRMTPAAEWLLDNFYLIEEQIRIAKRHLPKGYGRGLPSLAGENSTVQPRVYSIALETIAHGDGRWDADSLSRFVAAYQQVLPLTLGELWAIPIMLRLALIENLRRVGARIAAERIDRNVADSWADQMIDVAETDPKSLILLIADMARSTPPLLSAFVAELARRLQGQGTALALPLTWIEQRLSESGQTIDRLVQSENQQQAANQVSISNSIASLRRLGEMDWREFVEKLSVVEHCLQDEPAGLYGRMNFATRDHYRHVVESVARASNLSELAVARQSNELARECAMRLGSDDRRAHVGYYLIGPGLALLQRTTRAAKSPLEWLRSVLAKAPVFFYLGALAALTGLFTVGLVQSAQHSNVHGPLLVTLAIVLALVLSQLALTLINWAVTLLVKPHALPQMDCSKGIPPGWRTLVVVPAMLTSPTAIDGLVEALEVRFLGNRDDNLQFALLTDFTDAPNETMPDDADLQARVERGIEELNARYRGQHGDNFFLFHRKRQWNASQKNWMGYERKRGKLAALNSALRGKAGEFVRVVGRLDSLRPVRYVITLDTDTQLPREAARHLVGAMAHPLNRPRYDAARKRVVEGYAILQPRMAVSLPNRPQTPYARLCSSEPGIDPYTRMVSDVYQDIFAEGSFIGKGIYDVDVFEQALNGRFPENKILSHDLLEGCYARSGLVSDVPLYEEYPSSYLADARRRYRWIRGDWQLAGWLLPEVAREASGRELNPLSLLSVWKLFDNLRRSLVPIALLTLLSLTWLQLPHAGLWQLTVVGILLIPALVSTLLELVRRPREVLPRQHLVATARAMRSRLHQLLFSLLCLPHEAWFSLCAIAATVWRTQVSKRHLLEWTSSDESRLYQSNTLSSFVRAMWFGPVFAIFMAVLLLQLRADVLPMAASFLLLWCISPVLAWWLSQPLARSETQLSGVQTRFLRRTARKTWAYFEAFVGPEDHWLPPDNYQEAPAEALAHRTSPTNMGLALLANLSAHDFGYIGTSALIERCSNTLRTMTALERHRGHFYNWYDTLTLQALMPRYVSAVDSGNLAGHLLTLRQGLLTLPDAPLLSPRLYDGLLDTLGLVAEYAPERAQQPVSRFLQLLSAEPPLTLAEAAVNIVEFRQLSQEIAASMTATDAAHDSIADAAGHDWVQALLRHCLELSETLSLLTPWSSWTDVAIPELARIPSLREVANFSPDLAWAQGLAIEQKTQILAAARRAGLYLEQINLLQAQTWDMAQMDYDFLYDPATHLLSVGFNVDERRLDRGKYDLLSSEARLAIFVGIAQGKLPQESWFALGRQLTVVSGEPILVSWSGSMFEYLMPMLVMPSYENTLLDQTCRAAVRSQIDYGHQNNVPWGISESGFNTVDAQLNYQYRAFGVPGLGLKRGLAEDLVIAPYASLMALMIDAEASCQNLQRLSEEGAEGRYGFYEAIDFTAVRLPRGETRALVTSFMVHHQGMAFLALSYLLHERPMQRRFEADPLFQATSLLLQERIPKAVAYYSQAEPTTGLPSATQPGESSIRVFDTPHTSAPEVQLLSNGRYHLMLTQAGGGYSRWKDIAITRWREDATSDSWGVFCYVRDVSSGAYWSSSYQPTGGDAERFQAVFTEAHAEFKRRDFEIDCKTEVVVSPEDDIELRRLRLRNRSRTRRTLEVTSYAEVVLAPAMADQAHPAFSNLFVETEILKQQQAILCTRRPRGQNEQPPWMCHLLAVDGAHSSAISYETDRARFIGRGHTLANPQALLQKGDLSGTAGAVLDPIVSIRHRITLEPGASVTIDLVIGAADNRDNCMALVEKYRDRRLANRVFGLAWTHSQVLLRQLNAADADSQLYMRLASSIVYANGTRRPESAELALNRRGQSGLWGYSISGDLPIVLLRLEDAANIELVRQLVQAHAFWRLKGLAVDLVILNEDHGGYRQILNEQINGLLTLGITVNVNDRNGGIFVRSAEQISTEDRALLLAVARLIIADKRGSLAEQVNRRVAPPVQARLNTTPSRHRAQTLSAMPAPQLRFFNGLGGFSVDGREYVINTARGRETPAPWINVLANPTFGTVVSESGQCYTWIENAHELRLTPWDNDPVQDTAGEAFYVRDEDSGHFWSPTPLPRRGSGNYITRHGFGYSVFEHIEDGVHTELTLYVALDAPVKFITLKVRNASGRARRLSATGYVEWVLGDLRSKTAMHVQTEIAPRTGTLYARNRYNTEFGERTAFFDVDDVQRTFTGDRTEFIGRNGSLRQPQALVRSRLSGRVGAGLDPCGAIQVPFDLADGQTRTISFRLGLGRDTEDAAALVQRFRGSEAAEIALVAVNLYWRRTLDAVQVETPDPALDMLVNGWLVYQTLACRFWGRSGYYQSGGAFGFRDQLQDAMALIHTQPQRVREHILLCARHQFVEGDVLHWWHPPSGRGVRTRCSDDYLWLPLAMCRYVGMTGDYAILDEQLPFIQGRLLNADEESYYDLPQQSAEVDTLYQHGVRAILNGLHFGEHGLPLMGSGDWNDGMNLVGEHGRGESIWLGFFLFDVLTRFGELAASRGDETFAARCLAEKLRLQVSLELNGWDGAWYRRAYFDDGTPLGSSANVDCQIDSIAQSWSVLSQAGNSERALQAMGSLSERLVRRDDGLIQLLDPPFDASTLNPGYIKGYVPGVRENGGQYTHAAIWAAMAFARLGDREHAWELFNIINPVNHGKTREDIAVYKVEPYVAAADVYGVAPHTGRGGWTWYTGSAGWLYRLMTESLLGLTLEGDRLRLEPCLPADWKGFTLRYRYRDSLYVIVVEQVRDDASLVVDGNRAADAYIPLVDDGKTHQVVLRLKASAR